MWRIGSYITQGVYTVSGPFHPFGGAVDIVVVEQPDGTFKSAPWYVRFGKFQGVLKAREKEVNINVNGVDANFHMYLDHKGEAFFLREIDVEEGESNIYPLSGYDTDDNCSLRSKSCNCDSESGKVVMGRSSSHHDQLLGLRFGGRSCRGEIEGADVSKVGSLERAEIAADLLDLNWSTNVPRNRPPLKDRRKHSRRPSRSDSINKGLFNQPELKQEDCSNTNSELGQEKTVINLSAGIDVSQEGEGDPDGKEGAHDSASPDLHVACVEIEGIEKKLNGEEVSCVSIGGAPGNDVSEEEILADGVQTLVCRETSERLKVGVNCSSEQAPEVLCLDSGEVHAHDEVLHGTTTSPQPEGTETVKVTENVDHRTPVIEASELCSQAQQTYSLDSDASMYDVSDVEDHPTSPESQTSNTGTGHGSTKEVRKPPSAISQDDQTLDENCIKDKDVSSTFTSPMESPGDCLPTKATRKSRSTSSEDENFFFSDLDENRIGDTFDESGSPEFVDKGDPSVPNPSPGGNWRLWPFSSRRSESGNSLPPTPTHNRSTALGKFSEDRFSIDANKNEPKHHLRKKVRENTPTSEQLALLNLKEGKNTVTFTFSTAVLGRQQVDAQIYLWKWNTRIVISDVDGTITKSDVLGQFMPLVGIDWSQTGVAHLFSAIKENGYQLLFLSARSISQAYITRQFLFNIIQDGKVLPDGPVVISPDGLFPSLYREVIRRVPHEFKIACLEDIKALFPADCHPFYAGFGNRDTDEISYLKGEIVVNRCLDTKSYTSLNALVNGMFPPTNSSEQEDFNSWNFWKLPPPDVDI